MLMNLSQAFLLTQSVPEGRVFGVDAQMLTQIGIQLLNAIILAVALGFLLYKPVKKFMAERSERIKSNIDHAETTLAKGEQLAEEYQEKIRKIEQERVRVLEKAANEADERRRAIIAEAEKEASAIKESALDGIAEERKRLKEETRVHMIELAALIAQQYVTVNIDDDAQDQYFDQLLSRMEQS